MKNVICFMFLTDPSVDSSYSFKGCIHVPNLTKLNTLNMCSFCFVLFCFVLFCFVFFHFIFRGGVDGERETKRESQAGSMPSVEPGCGI